MRNFLHATLLFLALLGAVVFLSQTAAVRPVLATALPYAAIAIFLGGIVYRVAFKWGKAPVPFRIPTTGGQQTALPWLPAEKIDNPSTTLGVIARMALEILAFRSLFRNVNVQLKPGVQLSYQGGWELWAAAMAFHWSFLVVVVRHMRYFTAPVPELVRVLAALDGFFDIGVPAMYLTNAFILIGLGYLLVRRLTSRTVRYISLVSDYLALFLLLSIVGTGILMRYVAHTDVAAVKDLAIGLVTFHPVVPARIGWLFFTHLTLASLLLVYFPFSKLMHMPGVFMSPTRNLANNNRAVRHINPWNAPVKVHTYEEWEEDFHDKIKACGLPLDKP